MPYSTKLDQSLADKVNSGEMLDEAERTVLAATELSPQLREALMVRLRSLERQAEPLNWAWNILVNDYGYDGDRTAKDYQ